MRVHSTMKGHPTLPRQRTDDYTWLSVHVPQGMMDILRQIAADEERPISTVARRLIDEALQTRGHQLTWREVTEMERATPQPTEGDT